MSEPKSETQAAEIVQEVPTDAVDAQVEGRVDPAFVTASEAEPDAIDCFVVTYQNGLVRRVFSRESLSQLQNRIVSAIQKGKGAAFLRIPSEKEGELLLQDLDEDGNPELDEDREPVVTELPATVVRADLVLDVQEFDEDDVLRDLERDAEAAELEYREDQARERAVAAKPVKPAPPSMQVRPPATVPAPAPTAPAPATAPAHGKVRKQRPDLSTILKKPS